MFGKKNQPQTEQKELHAQVSPQKGSLDDFELLSKARIAMVPKHQPVQIYLPGTHHFGSNILWRFPIWEVSFVVRLEVVKITFLNIRNSQIWAALSPSQQVHGQWPVDFKRWTSPWWPSERRPKWWSNWRRISCEVLEPWGEMMKPVANL